MIAHRNSYWTRDAEGVYRASLEDGRLMWAARRLPTVWRYGFTLNGVDYANTFTAETAMLARRACERLANILPAESQAVRVLVGDTYQNMFDVDPDAPLVAATAAPFAPNQPLDAITTRYIGPSGARGARVKAKAQGGSVTVLWDAALSIDDNHRAAAEAIARRYGWTSDPFYMGRLHDGDCVFVQVSNFA